MIFIAIVIAFAIAIVVGVFLGKRDVACLCLLVVFAVAIAIVVGVYLWTCHLLLDCACLWFQRTPDLKGGPFESQNRIDSDQILIGFAL